MMAIVKTSHEVGYEYLEMPVPEPKADEVLLKVRKAVICGTDILIYKWDPLAQQVVGSLPFIPGHECCAEVVAAGADVKDISVGDRVCAETHIPCGDCYQCTHGLRHICRNLVLFGHHTNGCFAEYAVIPATAVYRLKTDLPDALASLLEPVGVSLRGVQEVEPQGDTLVVAGAGPIGVFAIALARHVGTTKIIASDASPYRLEIARKMGADVTVNVRKDDLREVVLEETDGDGTGCIVEASGAPQSVNGCFSYLRKGGKIVLLGNPKSPLEIPNVMPDLMHKELTLKTVHGRKMYETWETAESLLAERKVDVSPAVTHNFPMSRSNEAFQLILTGQTCKVGLEPRDYLSQ